jgi:hypothetical protein
LYRHSRDFAIDRRLKGIKPPRPMTHDLLESIIEKNSASCYSGKIPLWLVLLDNIPTLLLFVLGFLIIYQVQCIFHLP